MAEHMTFNHGVRSSTLRWVTKKRESILGGALLFLTSHQQSELLQTVRDPSYKVSIERFAVLGKARVISGFARNVSTSPMGH